MPAKTKLSEENGEIVESPVVPQSATRSQQNLSGFFDVTALGIEADPNAFSDQFKLDGLPEFTFRIREVGSKIKANDAAFSWRAAVELGLDQQARRALEREVDGQREVEEEEVKGRALAMLGAEVFRSDAELSTRFDELLHERYNAVILGDPDSDDPADWGGLVKWISTALPFTPDNVRAANVRLKSKLFERILVLSLYGVDDQFFRRKAR